MLRQPPPYLSRIFWNHKKDVISNAIIFLIRTIQLLMIQNLFETIYYEKRR